MDIRLAKKIKIFLKKGLAMESTIYAKKPKNMNKRISMQRI